ncbi:MAG: hypothetical protein IJY82_01115 [Oscillospiraceae bacterium]|nr:hypothetical protein [Oscillospiraceae bacterium]
MRADGTKWLAYDPCIGGSKKGALDFSWLNDAPAGKHGFVTTENGQFVFEDGTPIKFFGANLGFGAALPDKEVAEAMAEDLYRSGANFARLHATDCTYGGIIDYTQETTGQIDPEMVDRLDYLVYCLKEKGIYLHLDMTAGRAFHAADGFTEEELEYASQNVRAVRFFDERIIKLEMEYIERYLTHRNPYTGLRYVDEPAVAIVQYTNENSITWYQTPDTHTAFDKMLDLRFNLWLLDQYGNREALKAAWTNADGVCTLGREEDPSVGTVVRPPLSSWGEPVTEWNEAPDAVRAPVRHAEFMKFLQEIEEKTFAGVYKMMRDLGYRSAINLSNYPEAAMDLKMIAEGDVTEKNPYWNHPIGDYYPPSEFYPDEMASVDPREHRATHNSHSLGVSSRGRVWNKPFVITEWNATNTTPFRADALFQIAAYGALQDWSGFTLFIYTFEGSKEGFFGKKHFDTFFTSNIDPAMWAQFGIAAAIFRLGLVQKGRNRVELGVSDQDLLVQSGDYWRLPMYIPFVSRFGYHFIGDKYQGDADLVISAGNTASGDYTEAPRALVQSYNPFCDALQHQKDREGWLKKHTEPGSKTTALAGGLLHMSEKRAVYDAGVSNVTLGGENADVVLTEVMRKFGLLTAEQGWFGDKVVSDTGEITYDIRHGNFSVNTKRVAIFAGKSGGAHQLGDCIFCTENDRVGIAVFPLDGKNIDESEHLLIYAMGRCENTDREWQGSTMMTHGVEPIIYENVLGTLKIPTGRKAMSGWRLDTLGERVAEIPVEKTETGLVATLGGGHLYEITLS